MEIGSKYANNFILAVSGTGIHKIMIIEGGAWIYWAEDKGIVN